MAKFNLFLFEGTSAVVKSIFSRVLNLKGLFENPDGSSMSTYPEFRDS